MQEKDVEYKDKNGKTRVRKGSSPIREGVVNIKPDTKMDDLLNYVNRVHERWGIRAIQIHMHRDEGHYENPEDKSTWKPNLHVHIIWDWIDHQTGKSFKLKAEDMSQIQDMVAETLEMERGKRKEETGAVHLERADFILTNQRKQSAELDNEIAEKRDRLDTENGNAIKSGIANLFGKGKYADIEKENKRLKEELPKQKAAMQRQYQKALDAERNHHILQLAEKDKQIEDLQGKYKGEVFRHQQDNQGEELLGCHKDGILICGQRILTERHNSARSLPQGINALAIHVVDIARICFLRSSDKMALTIKIKLCNGIAFVELVNDLFLSPHVYSFRVTASAVKPMQFIFVLLKNYRTLR